jgi:DNA-binding transcriptional LysR family regulator
MDQWDDLRLFLAVARAGTLTGAAGEAGVNSSTLHRRLAAFEAEIGSTLFDKGPRGYRLTHAGEALLPRAEEVEEAVFAATRTVVGHDQQAAGEVRITLPLVLLPAVAPHLAAFTRLCRRIRPILQADDASLSLERDTDLALRATIRPAESAVGRKLCGMAWGRYVAAEADEAEAPWVHYLGMDGAPAVQWRRQTFGSAPGIMRVQGVMGMHSVLAASGAQGMLPCFIGDADPALRRLGEPVAMHPLWLLVHADLRRSARVRAMIDFLVPRILAERARFEATG